MKIAYSSTQQLVLSVLFSLLLISQSSAFDFDGLGGDVLPQASLLSGGASMDDIDAPPRASADSFDSIYANRALGRQIPNVIVKDVPDAPSLIQEEAIQTPSNTTKTNNTTITPAPSTTVTSNATTGTTTTTTTSTTAPATPVNYFAGASVVVDLKFDSATLPTGVTAGTGAKYGAGPSGPYAGVFDFDGTDNSFINLGKLTFGGKHLALRFIHQYRGDYFLKNWARLLDCADSTGANNLILTRVADTNDIGLWSFDSGATNGDYHVVASGVYGEANKWYDVFVTVDGTTQVASVYVNGQLVGQGLSFVPKRIERNQCYLGKSNWQGDAKFEGSIDRVSIYEGKAFTAADVQSIYLQDCKCNATVPVYTAGSSPSKALPASITATDKPIIDLGFDQAKPDSNVLLGPGVTWMATEGGRGGVYKLDGSRSSWIQLLNTNIGGDAMSVRIVAKSTGAAGSSSWPRIFDCGNGHGRDIISLARPGSGIDGAVWVARSDKVPSLIAETIPGGVPINQWLDYVITFSTAGANVYINGRLAFFASRTYPPNKKPRYSCYLGKSNTYWDSMFEGLIDRFQVFPTTLSESQIQDLFYADQGLAVPAKDYSLDYSWRTVPSGVPQPKIALSFDYPTHPDAAVGTGVTWSKGSDYHKGEMSFSGLRGSYIQLRPQLLGGGEFSVRVVAKSVGSALDLNWARFFDCGSGPDANNIVLGRNGISNKLFVGTFCQATGTAAEKYKTFSLSPTITDQTYMDIVLTIGSTSSGNSSCLYINGDKYACSTLCWPAASQRDRCYIGQSNWAWDSSFSGAFDKVQIWDSTKLTDANVKDMYHEDSQKGACQVNNGGCDGLTTCIPDKTDMWKQPTCSPCPTGYKNIALGANRTQCVDIDECNPTNPCQFGVACTNKPGFFECAPCPDGYSGNAATKCENINECTTTDPKLKHNCDILSPCQDFSPDPAKGIPKFKCGDCRTGYAKDAAGKCVDINECLTSPCHLTSNCTNTDGGYTCGPCPSGYRGNAFLPQGCVNINECKDTLVSAQCDSKTNCTDLSPGWRCSDCPSGWTTTRDTLGNTKCTDINECTVTGKNPCQLNVQCTNTQGDYICAPCPTGYGSDGDAKRGTCKDIDECKLGTHKCGPLTSCNNTAGSYICSTCPTGYKNVGTSTEPKCIDIDECSLTVNGGCDRLQVCNNTVPGFSCGTCPSGYTTQGNKCIDINECLINNGGCSVWSLGCNNTAGSRICRPCKPGFTGTGIDSLNTAGCTDINECLTNNGGCDPKSPCKNTDGSYYCDKCLDGYNTSYKLDGKSTICTDINECKVNNGGCDPLVTCTNFEGGFSCGACPTGYNNTKPGEKFPKCDDINECLLTPNGGCDKRTNCTNKPGTFGCTDCPAGYRMNSTLQCVDIDECKEQVNGGCDRRTTCMNTPGSRTCTACPVGFTGTGATGCIDINECVAPFPYNGGCHNLTRCKNNEPSFECTPCPSGYRDTDPGILTNCVDFDECSINNGGCDILSTCLNAPGNYSCGPCKAGYIYTTAVKPTVGDVNGKACVDINECLTNNGGCDKLSNCTNSIGSFSCGRCPAGYNGTGLTGCFDIDECGAGFPTNGGCDPLTKCQNSPGSFTCTSCPKGYNNTSLNVPYTMCTDINECLTKNGGCDPLVKCTNFIGNFSCATCPAGFTTVATATGGNVCNDINECLTNNGGCAKEATCFNTFGSRNCSDCPKGYYGSGYGECIDINECLINNGGCHSLTTCINTNGSRLCTACPAGYYGSGYTNCTDINECKVVLNGGCDTKSVGGCINYPGSFKCGECPSGYCNISTLPILSKCQDIDECAVNNGGCNKMINCTNEEGSFRCGTCPKGYINANKTECVDVNECLSNNGGCDSLTLCTNTNGNFTCGPCPAGYRGNGYTGCRDINECAENLKICDPLTKCNNLPGTFNCTACPGGYSGTGQTGCIDIDECKLKTHVCDAVTTCMNTIGSYNCTACPSGYINEYGVNARLTKCQDINECSPVNPCQQQVNCTNTPGNYNCAPCRPGYAGDAKLHTCKDIDECATNNGGCDKLSTCTNYPGTFACSPCPTGFVNYKSSLTKPIKSGYLDVNPHPILTNCSDIDECATNNGGCDPLVKCINTPGSRICPPCPKGYSGTGDTECIDINECLTDNGGCALDIPEVQGGRTCVNTNGSFYCADCLKGWRNNGSFACSDINECVETVNGGCHILTRCFNSPGSFKCGGCPPGYGYDLAQGCILTDYSVDPESGMLPAEGSDTYDFSSEDFPFSLSVTGQYGWTARSGIHNGVIQLKPGYITLDGQKFGGSLGFSVLISFRVSTVTNYSRIFSFSPSDDVVDNTISLHRLGLSQSAVYSVHKEKIKQEMIIPDFFGKIDEWVSLVVTHDTDGTVTAYKNGKLVISGKVHNPNAVMRRSFYIGRNRVDDKLTRMRGEIDTLSIYYDHAITAAAIADLYRIEIATPCEVNNGGCDPVVKCIPDTTNPYLPNTCAPCPTNYITVDSVSGGQPRCISSGVSADTDATTHSAFFTEVASKTSHSITRPSVSFISIAEQSRVQSPNPHHHATTTPRVRPTSSLRNLHQAIRTKRVNKH